MPHTQHNLIKRGMDAVGTTVSRLNPFQPRGASHGSSQHPYLNPSTASISSSLHTPIPPVHPIPSLPSSASTSFNDEQEVAAILTPNPNVSERDEPPQYSQNFTSRDTPPDLPERLPGHLVTSLVATKPKVHHPTHLEGHLRAYFGAADPPPAPSPPEAETSEVKRIAWKDRPTAPFPRVLFGALFSDYCTSSHIKIDPKDVRISFYQIWIAVISLHGDDLDEAHSTIDWPGVASKIAWSRPEEQLPEVYYKYLAPLVALWLRISRLTTSAIESDAAFPAIGGISGRWSSPAFLALRSSLEVLCHHFDQGHWGRFLANESSIPSGTDDNELISWLLYLATNPEMRQVACELRKKPARFLLDLLDKVLPSFDSLTPEHEPLRAFYIDIAGSAHDLPSRIWMEPIKYDRYGPSFMAGSMSIYNEQRKDTRYSICVNLYKSGTTDSARIRWAAEKDYFGALATLLHLNYPTILSLAGVFWSTSDPFTPLCAVYSEMPSPRTNDPFYVPLEDPIRLIRSLADGFEYLHRLRIVQGDVQWPNFIINPESSALFWNFGVSRTYHHETADSYRLDYNKPNQTVDQPPTLEGDIFSCGLLLLSVLMSPSSCGEGTLEPTDFRTQAFQTLSVRIASAFCFSTSFPDMPPALSQLKGVDPQQGKLLWQLVLDMLNVNSSNITMSKVVSRLNDILNVSKDCIISGL